MMKKRNVKGMAVDHLGYQIFKMAEE